MSCMMCLFIFISITKMENVLNINKTCLLHLFTTIFLCYFLAKSFWRTSVANPPYYIREFDEKISSSIQSYNEDDVKTIMIATTNYKYANQHYLANCPRKCRIVSLETSARELLTADAFVFHPVNDDFNVRFFNWISHRRRPEQLFIFHAMEPPIIFNRRLPGRMKSLRYFNYHFNMTMTYRRDSDIFLPYNDFLGYEPIGKHESPKIIHHRGKFAEKRHIAAVISNCEKGSYDRFKVLIDLGYRFGLKVDIYGKCGPLKCPGERIGDGCYKFLEQNYLFYASFENSICPDYITEKFYNILKYDMVPVVIGGGSYREISPPHSYINLRDFKSAKSVAKFILKLAENEEEYNTYFEWKKRYRLKYLQHGPYCEICIRLHENKGNAYVSRFYGNLDAWFNSSCSAEEQDVLIGTL